MNQIIFGPLRNIVIRDLIRNPSTPAQPHLERRWSGIPAFAGMTRRETVSLA
jgi:hypothetical protein